jgi:hypothetical protein
LHDANEATMKVRIAGAIEARALVGVMKELGS